MKKLKLLFFGLFFVFGVNIAQEHGYHDNDYYRLYNFMCENATDEYGGLLEETNAHLLLDNGIAEDWHTNSEWLTYLHEKEIVVWDDVEEGLLRITKIQLRKDYTQFGKFLSGELNFSGCTSLDTVECYGEKLTAVNFDSCENLKEVQLNNNEITSANFENCNKIKAVKISNNKLLPSQIKFTQLPQECFIFSGQNVSETAYTLVYKDDELYVAIDLNAEMNSGWMEQFDKCYFFEGRGIHPENDQDNSGIFYYKLENLQKADLITPIFIQYHIPDHYDYSGTLEYESNIIRSMGRIKIYTQPSVANATAYIYLAQNSGYILAEIIEGFGPHKNTTCRLPAGEYIIGIDASGYLFSFYSDDEFPVTSWRDERITKVFPYDTHVFVVLEEKPEMRNDEIAIGGILEEVTSKSLLKATPRVLQRSTVTLHSLSTTSIDEWILVATTQTDDDGAYSFSSLPRRAYRVTVEIPGFENAQSIYLQANTTGEVFENQNFLVNEETQTITANILTSVLSNDVIQLSVYPNPVTDVVHIGGLNGAYTVRIFNMTGQVVKSAMGASPELTLNLNDLSSGMYLIRIESQGRTHTSKVIKK